MSYVHPLSHLAAGLLFGTGLTVAGMTNPDKVLSFLDVFGTWDPSLAVVMASALAVTAIGYRLARRRPQPVLAPRFVIPTNRRVDRSLLVGAALFGAGWGLVGLCPGPALASLSIGGVPAFGFVAAMLAGMGLYRLMRAAVPQGRAA